MDALIESLKDEAGNVKVKAAEALRIITKKDFGQNYEKWAHWQKKSE